MSTVKKKKKSKHGGERPNAGRKKVADPKQGVTIYIETSVIEANGGVLEGEKWNQTAVKEKIEAFLRREAVKKKK